MTPAGPHQRRLHRALIALAGCVALAGAAYGLSPGYLIVDIPVARHQGSGAFWHETQWSELRYADSAGNLYVHRQVGTAYPETHRWSTPEEALAFFSVQLTARGWRLSGYAGNDPVLPESRLVEHRLVNRYVRNDDPTSETDLHVAVWPIGGTVTGFHVVLTSANPSLLRRVSRAFD